MKTSYVIKGLPAKYSRDVGDARMLKASLTSSGKSPSAMSVEARRAARKRYLKQLEEGRIKFSPKTQPRDPAGKFRKVLARLKINLGKDATESIAKKIEETEAAGAVGDFAKAKIAGTELLKLIDSVEHHSLNKGATANLRRGAAELGRLMAYLPMQQGNASAKVRFSDLPDPVASLIRNLIKRVDSKLSAEDAEKYTSNLESFMSGGQMLSSDGLAAELSRLLRVLA